MIDIQALEGTDGDTGKAIGMPAVARMTAERLESAGIAVKALVLPPNLFSGATTAYGYAHVPQPGVLA
ncbi:hypothetical protein [Nonomuraea sp. NPDC046570]|uniref:hypothetical protein n=1 Tax=Nonomuraea sp. NPDC046570 TaxID=3155255 RepID=UPI0033E29C62